MADKKEIRCKKCGGTITIESSMTDGFCLHCGERFVLEADSPAANHAETLLNQEAWAALADYIGDSADPGLRLLKLAAQMHLTVDDYLKDAEALAKSTNQSGLMKLFTSKNPYSDDPMHGVFFERVREQAEQAAALLEECGAQSPLCSRAALEIADLLLSVDKQRDTKTYWSLVAVEQHALPVIPYLELEPLMARYTAYNKINPDSQSLPAQMKIKKSMIETIRKQGGEVPKKKWFGKK